MLPLKIPEQKYVVSLDSIDMSFLSQYVEKPPEAKRLLWSRPSVKEEIEYYQVEIVAEKEENSYIIESSSTEMCHICNKDVPQMYFSQHIKSKMHQNHEKLTDRILQNLSKQINSEITNIENSKPNNLFYCETCSKLVPSEDKKKHKISQYHVKSVEIEKLMDNFLEVFCNTEEIKAETGGKKKKTRARNKKKTLKNDVKKEIIDQTNSEYNSCSDSEIDVCNPFSKKNNTIFPINDVNKSSNTLNSYEIGHETANLFSEEGPEILELHKTTFDLNDTRKIINVVNGNGVQKTYKTSETFITFSDTDWSDSIGESDNEITEQTKFNGAISYAGALSKVAPKIEQKVAKPNIPQPKPPIIGKVCVEFILYLKRMIEKYGLNYDLPMVEDNKIVIVTPKGFTEKISIDAFHGFSTLSHFAYCHLCFKCIDVDTKEHSETENHVRNILRPINDDFAREWIRNKYVVAHCLLCNETLPGNSNHAASSPNHKKYQETITIKKDVPVKPENVSKKTYCDICKINIDVHNISAHTSSKNHKLNMLTNKATPPQNSATNTEYCDICKVHVPTGGMGIHEAGKPHKEAKIALTKSKGPKSNTSKDTPMPAVVEHITTSQDAATNMEYCHICKVKVPKNGMAVHETGKPHKKTMMAKISNIVQNLAVRFDNSTADILKLPGISKATPASSMSEKSSTGLTTQEKLIEYNKQMAVCSKSEAVCLVCKSRMSNSDSHVIEHIEGARHRSAVAILLRENQINSISTKLYYCQICKKTNDNFVYHVQENIDHQAKKILCSGMIDKDILRSYIYQNPEDDSSLAVAYRKVYETLLDRNKIVRLPNSQYNCKVCSIKMTRISEFDHMFGERHKTSLNSQIAEHNK